MTVENAKAFLDELLDGKGHSHELLSKIGTEFDKEHIAEALKARGTSKDELLKAAAGGSFTSDAAITAASAIVPVVAASAAA